MANANADWSNVDAAAAAGGVLPASVIGSSTSCSDLFGGELFGDELIDMYNSVAAVGGMDESDISGLSLRLPEAPAGPALDVVQQKRTNTGITAAADANHHTPGGGTQVALAAAALDDGLGAFSPSTSFNDLAHLLPNPTATNNNNDTGEIVDGIGALSSAQAPPSIMDDLKVATPKIEQGSRKKRKSTTDNNNGPDGPATTASSSKRRTTGHNNNKSLPKARGASSSSATSSSTRRGVAAPKLCNNNKSVVVGASVVSPKTTATVPGTQQYAVGIAAKHQVITNKKQQQQTNAVVNTPDPLSMSSITLPTSSATQKLAAPAVVSGGAETTATPLMMASAAAAAGPHVVVGTTTQVASRSDAEVKENESITSHAATATAAAAASKVAASKATGTSSSSSSSTEADFKSVAQAAVSNLILNAGGGGIHGGVNNIVQGNNQQGYSVEQFGGQRIDTSTAHIAALTSSNWVNACCTGAAGGGDSSSNNNNTTTNGNEAAAEAVAAAAEADSKANNRAKRQNLTPDERARQNRDRNREHARNTRLRKKAYVEELKRTLTELVGQRDAAELEKRHSAQRELEQREVRFRVMEEFLNLRGRNETNFARWIAILEDGFTMTLPRIPYSKLGLEENEAAADANNNTTTSDGNCNFNHEVLRGAAEVMSDSSRFSTMLQTTAVGGAERKLVSVVFSCDRKNFFMDGCNTVLNWSAVTVDSSSSSSSEQDARTEVIKFGGIMKAVFSPASNKLLSVEFHFDAGCVSEQVLSSRNVPSTTSEAPAASCAGASCNNAVAAAAAAAQAAHDADALLDSIQMPHLCVVPSSSSVVIPSAAAMNISDCSSSDEDAGAHNEDSSCATLPQQQATNCSSVAAVAPITRRGIICNSSRSSSDNN